MELVESKKYKIRLVIIIAIIVISAILGTITGKIAYDSLFPTYLVIEDSIETLQNTSDEDYLRVLKEKHPDLLDDNDMRSREELLDALIKIRDSAESRVISFGIGGMSASLYLAFSGIAFGTMLIVIIVRKMMYKIWNDLKLWITILIPILIVTLLFFISPTLYFLFFGYIGMFAQLPLLIYTAVKYRKTKKAEDKDDIIESKDEDVSKETKEEE